MDLGLVVDNSIVMAWFFDDEEDSYARGVLAYLQRGKAVQPSVWPLELGNALVVAERRNRLGREHIDQFVRRLEKLSMNVEFEPAGRAIGEILALAREHQLFTYDASYLDLAMRQGLPLATLDKSLRRAAGKCGVPLFKP